MNSSFLASSVRNCLDVSIVFGITAKKASRVVTSTCVREASRRRFIPASLQNSLPKALVGEN
jgi:hypothetical protein